MGIEGFNMIAMSRNNNDNVILFMSFVIERFAMPFSMVFISLVPKNEQKSYQKDYFIGILSDFIG